MGGANNMKNTLIAFIVLILASCKPPEGNLSPQKISFKQEMRNLIIGVSESAKAKNPNFAIISQNGHELLKTDDGTQANSGYQNALDGIAIDHFFVFLIYRCFL